MTRRRRPANTAISAVAASRRPRLPCGRLARLGAVWSLTATVLLAGCGQGENTEDPAQVDRVAPPASGACRELGAEQTARTVDDTRTVDCAQPHTAETYYVGTLPDGSTADRAEKPTDAAVEAVARETCAARLTSHLGNDESAALRSLLTWVWFGPSETAWEKGARWFRCDVMAQVSPTSAYLPLPTTTRNLLHGLPENRWMLCARGESVDDSEKLACDQPHDWRAATTIVLGKAGDPWPGTAAVEKRTDDFCRRSVGGWLGYPDDYDYGFTWFDERAWEAGNRRSVCWARTDD